MKDIVEESKKMNREVLEQICQDVAENFVSINSKEQDEVNFLDMVHRKIANHYNVFPVRQKVEGVPLADEYKWNISQKVSPTKYNFDCLEIIGEYLNKVLDKYHSKP